MSGPDSFCQISSDKKNIFGEIGVMFGQVAVTIVKEDTDLLQKFMMNQANHYFDFSYIINVISRRILVIS